jgi:hypothetical protein
MIGYFLVENIENNLWEEKQIEGYDLGNRKERDYKSSLNQSV